MLDVLVVGAGPAGLTCALYLARYHRSLALVDAGDSRARYIPVSHNTPGFAHGVSGEEFLEQLRAQAAQYGAVAEHGTVQRLARSGEGFTATLGGRQLAARHVVLATGVVDRLPAIPDVERAVHDGLVRLCPVCDAYETAGRRIAVLGASAAACHHAHYLRSFCNDVTALCEGPERADAALRERMAAAGVDLLDDLAGLAVEEDVVVVTLSNGRRERFDALYPFLGATSRCQLATGLGAACADDGQLKVDEHLQTSVPGLYAIGDVVDGLNQISVAVGHAARAATHIHNRLPFRPYPPR